MSMLRYYTDDSPGLKITPVRTAYVYNHLRNEYVCWTFFVYLTSTTCSDNLSLVVIDLAALNLQVVVLLMSVCFIAFVTVLHAVAKIYQFRSS